MFVNWNTIEEFKQMTLDFRVKKKVLCFDWVNKWNGKNSVCEVCSHVILNFFLTFVCHRCRRVILIWYQTFPIDKLRCKVIQYLLHLFWIGFLQKAAGKLSIKTLSNFASWRESSLLQPGLFAANGPINEYVSLHWLKGEKKD